MSTITLRAKRTFLAEVFDGQTMPSLIMEFLYHNSRQRGTWALSPHFLDKYPPEAPSYLVEHNPDQYPRIHLPGTIIIVNQYGNLEALEPQSWTHDYEEVP